MKIVSTERTFVHISLPHITKTEIFRKINLAITGKENCNEYDGEKIVPINSPEIDKQLCHAHRNAAMSRSVEIEFDVTDKGEFVNFRFVKET